MLDGNELDGPPPLRRASTIETSSSPPMHHSSRLTRRASLDDLEQESCQLTPKIDHRIIIITSEDVNLSTYNYYELLIAVFLQKYNELVLQRQRIEQDSIIEEVDEYSPQS